MRAPQTPDASQLAAALAWWRDAGVDCDFHDSAAQWLAPPPAVVHAIPEVQQERAPAPPEQATAAVEIRRIGGDPAGWPTMFEDFSAWWTSDPALDEGGTGARIAPRGSKGAKLMALVLHPENEDSERLLAGAQGRLLDSMLAAMGLSEGEIYVASAFPRHLPHADWTDLAARGLRNITTHHIALAAPERLIVFGQNVLPLLGHDPTNSAESLDRFNHEGRSIPVLPLMGLEALLAAPRRRASVWRRWLDWTETQTL